MTTAEIEETRSARILRRYLRVAPLARSLIRSREIELLADQLGSEGAPRRNAPRSGRIIDLGHGDGHFAAVLEEEGIQLFVGMDRSLNELRRARGRSKARLIVGDMEHAPFRTGVFDAAISNCVLEHVEKVETAFGETARIIRPGGEFLATVVTDRYEELLFWPRIFERIGWNNLKRRYLDMLQRRFQHCHYITPGKWIQLAFVAGFEAASTETYIGKRRQRLMDLFLPFVLCARLLRFFFGREVILPIRWPARFLVYRLRRDDAEAKAGVAANALLILRRRSS